MYELPGEVVELSYFSIPIIDLYYKLGQTEKGNKFLADMIDTQIIEIKYLKEFDRGSGLKQEIAITGQILASLARVVQIHKLEDATYNYSSTNGMYYKEKEGIKKEIDFHTYRINTFMDEYLNIQ